MLSTATSLVCKIFSFGLSADVVQSSNLTPMDNSWNSQMGGEQNEIEGPAAHPVVLPGWRETMPRRERLQDARVIRGSALIYDKRRRERRAAHRRLFF
jgi:hypothetical protein